MIVSRRAIAHTAAALLAGISALALPNLGWASSGGAAPSPSGSPGGSGTPGGNGNTPQPTQAGTVAPGNVTVSASGAGITVATHASAMLRNRLRFKGDAPSSAAGHIVEIDRLGRQTNWVWTPTAHGRVRSDGSFSAAWRTNHIGRFAIRAVVAGSRGPRAAGATPTLTVTVYRVATATQYGPGFYGQTTACGKKLTRRMLGVAHRTLKCGTHVAIYYRGKTIMVPVIDRGPYATGVDWDLTEATGRALGMSGTARIGAVSVPRR